MLSNRHLYNTYRVIPKRITRFADISATIFILCSALVLFPSVAIYLVIFGAVLVLLCAKNFPAVMVGVCVGGMPFLSLVKSTFGLSITQSIICMITIELIMLAFYKRGTSTLGYDKNQFIKYSIWIVAVYFFVLANYAVAPQTGYHLYYVQFFIVYVTFSCLSGMLVVQRSLSLEDVLLPVMLFFGCVFPVFNFTLFNIPVEIANSAIGLRGHGGLGSISLGRLAGSLIVLAFFVLWETRNISNHKVLFIQGTTGLVMALPILWYTQTRQAMISAFLIIVMGVLFQLLRESKFTARQYIATLFFVVLLIWGSNAFLSWAGTHLSQERVHANLTDSARMYQWQNAWEGISKAPIFGYGLAGYYTQYGIWPHNFVLEVWYDYGIAGLLLFGGLLSIVFERFRRKQDGYFFWLLLGVYWIIVAQVSADLPRNSIVFFFVTIALLLPKNTQIKDLGQ